MNQFLKDKKTDIYLPELISIVGEEIVEKLRATEQNPQWHPEGNVLNHTLEVMERADEALGVPPELYISAMFHDLGKIDATFVKNGKIVSYGHENYAEKYIDKFWDNVIREFGDGIDKDLVKYICQNHMKMHIYDQMSEPKKAAMNHHPNFALLMKFSKFDS